MTRALSPTSCPDLPPELFLDDIFPYLPVSDLLHLGSTNRYFNALTNDETYWRMRIQEDFNFPGFDAARKTGWKFLYKRLRNPLLYVWGEKSNGRLGLTNPPKTSVRDGVPYPVRLDIPGVRLNGSFAEPGQKADRPMRLDLPSKFRSISCGRLHTSGLDTASDVWTFTSWGRPFRLNSALLDKSSPETTPVQVESGWSFSSVLTQSGDVLVYWPFRGRMKSEIDTKNAQLDDVEDPGYDPIKSRANFSGPVPVIPCYWWDLHRVDPVRLPSLPTHVLPKLRKSGLPSEQLDGETKLVNIAGLDNCIVGLTNKGHVLRYDRLNGEETYPQGQWEYLPYFSDIELLRDNVIYNTPNGGDALQVDRPETMHITHISGSYQTFFAYSTGTHSVLLKGNNTAVPAVTYVPTIIPELQNRAVISVVLGDSHYGALTGAGELLTWGAFSEGALGLGDPARIPVGQPGGFSFGGDLPHVRVPTPVRFDYDEHRASDKYCLAAAALGWHTGALVIDLDQPDEDGDDDADGDLKISDVFPIRGPELA